MIDPSRSYLVTGGAGFVGSNLVHALVAAGAPVRVVDDFSTGRRENLDGVLDRIELVEGTLVDPDVCKRAVQGMDFVLHQAAIPSVPRSVANPVATHHACATGTLNLLQASTEAGVKRFVYAGSSSCYGESPTLPKREEMPTKPMSPYAVAKLAGEQYCAAWAKVFGLETVALRYFNVFGPRQDPSSQYSAVIPLFMGLGLRNESPTIHGDGGQTRDFTHVENVIQANLLACVAPTAGCAGRIFNVGGGERISVNRLWTEIAELTGASAEPVYAPGRAGDVRDSLASLDEIRAGLGYEVVVGLRQGLEATLAWYREAGSLVAGEQPGC